MNVDLSELRSSGIAFLNTKQADSSNKEATIIVVGVPRSGTTMVAGCLRHIGVYIGDKANNGVNEDVEVAEAIESGDRFRISSIIYERNAKNIIWGFKRPAAFKKINTYIDLFRNPKLVVVYRDAAAIAKRNEISMHMDFKEALRLASDDISELTKFVCGTTVPSMIVSYEKSLQEPRQFVQMLAEFCGVPPTQEDVERAVNSIENGPEAYLNESRLHFEGHLDQVKDGFARGWARRVGQAHPQTVIVMAGQEIIGRGSANLFREDLKKAGKEDGNCAFNIKIEKKCIESKDVIAMIAGSKFQINK